MRWKPISTANPLARLIGISTDQNDAPVARWTSIPLQIVRDGDLVKASVIAFHKSGINRVEFVCDGGHDIDADHHITVTDTIVNESSKQDEYVCSLKVGPLWTEGLHTIRAIVYPNSGGKRVLQGTWLPKSNISDTSYEYSIDGEVDFTFVVNRGAFDGIKFWVDSISGSDNNVGS